MYCSFAKQLTLQLVLVAQFATRNTHNIISNTFKQNNVECNDVWKEHDYYNLFDKNSDCRLLGLKNANVKVAVK